ncbi:MAG: hypothetical protein OJF55_000609 [Rhodanobacteraceae bacterium]|nr:MAG: hypothetical protein OJF55_000609 [Rhodanobacteraceae bacterium]
MSHPAAAPGGGKSGGDGRIRGRPGIPQVPHSVRHFFASAEHAVEPPAGDAVVHRAGSRPRGAR